MIHSLGISDFVQYIGEVDGRAKENAYRSADLFILPTFSENFGLVVAEALSYGVPVITTKGAPWSDLVEYKCGWWIDIGVEPLALALKDATSLADDQLKLMGKRGKDYVQRFNWFDIAKKTIDLYRWILNGGDHPIFLFKN